MSQYPGAELRDREIILKQYSPVSRKPARSITWKFPYNQLVSEAILRFSS